MAAEMLLAEPTPSTDMSLDWLVRLLIDACHPSAGAVAAADEARAYLSMSSVVKSIALR